MRAEDTQRERRRGEKITDGGVLAMCDDDDDVIKWAPAHRAWINCVCVCVCVVGVLGVCHSAQHSCPLTQ